MHTSVHGPRGTKGYILRLGPQSSAEIILDYRQAISYYALSVVCRPIFTCFVISEDSGAFIDFFTFQKMSFIFR